MPEREKFNDIGRKGEIYSSALEQARKMRKMQTEAEAAMWDILRGRRFEGLKFYRQRPLFFELMQMRSFYIPDFYCRSKHLVIEVDGPIHKQRWGYDQARSEILAAIGLTVIRFTNDEVLGEPSQVIGRLLDALGHEVKKV